MESTFKDEILEFLSPPAGFQNWHGGPTLTGALRGVDYKQAAWKPFPDRHNIWELVLHIAYWKYAVRRYFDPGAEKGFVRSPANWPEIDTVSVAAWRDDKQLVKTEHEKLNEVIQAFPAAKLNQKIAKKKKWTFSQLLLGIAAHDTYHIGQIQLMKRLYKEKMKL